MNIFVFLVTDKRDGSSMYLSVTDHTIRHAKKEARKVLGEHWSIKRVNNRLEVVD